MCRERDLLRFRLPSFQRKLERARETVRRALAECERPYVAFSGGKDSLLVLALAAAERPGIVALWSDDELEYPEQPQYIPAACAALGVRLLVVHGRSVHDGWFETWSSEPYWREPLPGSIRIPGLANDYMFEQGYDGVFLGLRGEENARRRRYLKACGPIRNSGRGVQCNPLAGWTTDEVWAAIAGLGLPYNPVYDRLTAIGVERELQRVGPLPLAPGWILQRGWPEMYRDLVARYGQRW